MARYDVSSAIIGLSLSYSLQVTGLLSWCVRQFSEAEVAMNAVERVHHFGENLEQESPALIEGIKPENWPASGTVSIEKIDVCYRPGLPLVLVIKLNLILSLESSVIRNWLADEGWPCWKNWFWKEHNCKRSFPCHGIISW
jgi:hypothetical protein